MDHKSISPEEILKMKEMSGGLVFDDPDLNSQQENVVNSDATETKTYAPKPEVQQLSKPLDPNSLGKSQTMKKQPTMDIGWKNIPVSMLPSGGLFYPDGTKIAIRAAEVREIRHFSTIDEDDKIDIEEKISYVIDRCFRMDFPGEGVVSYKDLKQEDRFFILMAIRDLTFVKGENSIILKPYKKCKNTLDCPFRDGIELRTGVLSSYKLDEKISEYYSPQSRSFVFNIKKIEKSIELFIPSIGITEAITSFVIECSKRNIEIDDGFLKISPFIFDDWRDVNFDTILRKMRESDYWTKEEYSLYFELSERIKIGTKLEVNQKCPVCGDEEVAASISFPDGIRSLFVISDIFGQLL